MFITVEISYYPLAADYEKPVREFLELLSADNSLTVAVGAMSTLVSGEYDEVMLLLAGAMKELLEEYPSVFTIKLANACRL